MFILKLQFLYIYIFFKNHSNPQHIVGFSRIEWPFFSYFLIIQTESDFTFLPFVPKKHTKREIFFCEKKAGKIKRVTKERTKYTDKNKARGNQISLTSKPIFQKRSFGFPTNSLERLMLKFSLFNFFPRKHTDP